MQFFKKKKQVTVQKLLNWLTREKNNNQAENFKDIQKKKSLCPLSKLVDWLTCRNCSTRENRELKIFKGVSLSVVDLVN